MRVSFNDKEYKKDGRNNDGLGVLCYDIFKIYLEKNKDKSYKELQEIFRENHKEFSGNKSKKKIIFNKKDLDKWLNNDDNKDSRKNERYFGHGNYGSPIQYNNEELFFTTQWGNKKGEDLGNIDRMIDFAKKQDYSIDVRKENDEVKVDIFTNKYTIKNIILYGAPGVGKTHNTNKLISLIESANKSDIEIFKNIKNNTEETIILNDDIKSRVKFITFHQSYSYEDFIEGFRPNKTGNIELKDGIFKKLCDDASKSDKNFYIVIDEINRGNISKIFGELITLIEEDKRNKYEVTLPYSKEPFKVPSNLYIIATMNSTDKSIATIDIALRRRFTFLKMKPNLELVTVKNAKILMNNLNEYIKDNLSEDYMLGHSYFMGKNIDLEFIKEYKIRPLLEEYFYADDDKLKEILDLLKSVDD